MLASMIKRLIVLSLIFCRSTTADPLFHKFQMWGIAETPKEQLLLYSGWTNGFFLARGRVDSKKAGPLFNCLLTMTGQEAASMIDRYYKSNPEKWSEPFGEQILAALTVPGSPCYRKSPLRAK